MAAKRWKIKNVAKGRVVNTPGTTYLDDFSPEPSDWISALYHADTPNYAGRSTLLPVYPQHRMALRERNPVLSCPTMAEYNQGGNDNTVWSFEIQTIAGTPVGTFTTDPGFNHLPLPIDLPTGRLKWRVTDPSYGVTSAFREFDVLPDAVHVNSPTRAASAGVIAARARPRFLPASLAHYNTVRLRAQQLMVTRSSSYLGAALPSATGFSITTVLLELTYIADLRHLWKITGNVIYKNEAIRRIEGNGSTTGIAYWEPNEVGASWTNDDLYRYALEVMGPAYDSFASDITPAARLALYTNIARRIDYGMWRPTAWNKLFDPTTGVFPGGRWLGMTYKFGGHLHNLIRCVCLGAAAIQGDHTLYPGVYSAQANCNEMCRFAVISTRWSTSMRTDAGGHPEGRGYQEADYDFEYALNCLGHALGIDVPNIPANKQAARMSALLYPPTTAYHVSGDGHDTTIRWSAKYLKAMRRAGNIAEARLTQLGPNVTEAFLQDIKADDYHDLSPVAEAALESLASVPRAAYTDTMVAFHSDLTNIDRFSVHMPSTPYGGLNHAHISPGARYFSLFQQALTRRRSVYDYFASPAQELEGGWAAGGSFVIGFGNDFSAAANAVQASTQARRSRSYTRQFVDDSDRKVLIHTRELTTAVDVSVSIPVKSNPANTAYFKWPTAKRSTAVEQTITVTNTGSGITMVGSVSGPLPTAGYYADNQQVYLQLVPGNSVAGDTFTFDIVKVNRAQAFDVMLGEGVHVMGNHYEFATARPAALMFGTADVAAVTITVDATGLAVATLPNARLTAGLPVPIEILTAVTPGVNGLYTATATSPTTFTFQTTAAPGAVNGFTRVNLGVQVQGNDLIVRNGMNPSGATATMRVRMLKPAANLRLGAFPWRHPDNQLASGNANTVTTELGTGVPFQSPAFHVSANRIEFAASAQLSGFLALATPDGVAAPTIISNTTVGSGSSTVSTLVVTVEGTTYTVVHTAATNIITVA